MESIPVRFQRFHTANPHVYNRLVALARQWAGKHTGKQSIAMLYEVLRWEWGTSASTTTTGDPFKLNNDYRAYYARLIMEQEGDLAGRFETRGEGSDPFGHRLHPDQDSFWDEAA